MSGLLRILSKVSDFLFKKPAFSHSRMPFFEKVFPESVYLILFINKPCFLLKSRLQKIIFFN